MDGKNLGYVFLKVNDSDSAVVLASLLMKCFLNIEFADHNVLEVYVDLQLTIQRQKTGLVAVH